MIRHADAMPVETREAMRGGRGTVTMQHVFKSGEFTANARLCARLTLPPGASIGPHSHDTEDEVYIVIRGEGLLDDGKTKSRIRAGDAVLTGNGESHALENPGKEDLELIAGILCYDGGSANDASRA